MERKVIRIPAPSEGHTLAILEYNHANIYGYIQGDNYITESKYHKNGNYTKVNLIGEFSVDVDEEIEEDGHLISDGIHHKKKTLNYQLYVYDKEGIIPHFHIVEKRSGSRNSTVDCCICIFEPRYFDHGTHMSTLPRNKLKVLDGFLRTECSYTVSGYTYWNKIVDTWIEYNRDNYIKYPHLYCCNTQPDYTNMLGFRSE